jgi:hypothetical protein
MGDYIKAWLDSFEHKLRDPVLHFSTDRDAEERQ